MTDTASATIESNMRLVWFILRQQFPGKDISEAVSSQAIAGLWKASERFDAGRGVQFATYAATYIRGYALHEYVREARRMSRLPDHTAITEHTDGVPHVRSEEIDAGEAREEVQRLMRHLDERAAELVRRVYLEGESIRQASDAMGLSHNGGGYILRKALGEMRRRVESENEVA